tara:strand:- start:214 stop:429 length:216 start_codon:yes stop_codon:yes gene_type:complete
MTQRLDMQPKWIVKIQQLITVIENSEADPERAAEARESLINLATYVDLMNSLQIGVFEETVTFSDDPVMLH